MPERGAPVSRVPPRPPARGEERDGGIGGQAVVRQLEGREREEGEEGGRPQGERHPRNLLGGPPGAALDELRDLEGGGNRPRKGPEPGHEEELERGERHVLVGESAQPNRVEKMVVHDRVPEEARVARGGERVPAQSQDEERYHARCGQPATYRAQPPGEREGERDGHEWSREPDDVLAERSHAKRRAPDHRPAPAWGAWRAEGLRWAGPRQSRGERIGGSGAAPP